jgi:hypothetical protein
MQLDLIHILGRNILMLVSLLLRLYFPNSFYLLDGHCPAQLSVSISLRHVAYATICFFIFTFSLWDFDISLFQGAYSNDDNFSKVQRHSNFNLKFSVSSIFSRGGNSLYIYRKKFLSRYLEHFPCQLWNTSLTTYY